MSPIFILILQASVSMLLFYAVYRLVLNNEMFFTINRFYLLGSLLFSIVLPLFPVKFSVELPANSPVLYDVLQSELLPGTENTGTIVHSSFSASAYNIIMLIYFIGALFIFTRLIVNTIILSAEISRSGTKMEQNMKIVENQRYNSPFSFFGYIFINPKSHTEEDLGGIIAHEKVHIREHHWADLLVIELLTVIFWFNPVVWWYGRAIRQNHEYLADRGVLAQGCSVGRYQALLINQLMGAEVVGLTHRLNYSVDTTRLTMMTKTKKSGNRAVRLIWVLPVVAVLMTAFAKPEYKTVAAEKINETDHPQTIMAQNQMKTVAGKVLKSDGTPLHGASVILKGTHIGTLADSKGEFKLDIPDEKDYVLSVSYVGYETYTVPVPGTGGIPDPVALAVDITMKEGVFIIDPGYHFNLPPPPAAIPSGRQGANTPGSDTEEIFIVVEQMPQYTENFYGLGKYVTGQQSAMANKGIKGKATIGFTVSETGKVVNVRVLEQDNAAAGKAGVDLVSNMKDWKPGAQRGKPVPVNYALPVTF